MKISKLFGAFAAVTVLAASAFFVSCSTGGGGGSSGSPIQPAHEHTFSSAWTITETHHWHAATCEHTNEVKNKAEHHFGEWYVTTQPTEEAEGAEERECSKCGYKIEKTIPKLDHAHAKGMHHEPTTGTCATKGTIEYYDCTNADCEIKLDLDGNPLATIESVLDPENHEGTATWKKTAATHKETYDCCDAVKTAEAAHTWNEGVVTKEPTITEEGVKIFTCTVEGCGQTKAESIDELMVFDAYEEPVDAETGLAATSSSTYIYFGVFPKTVLASDSSVTVNETKTIAVGTKKYCKGSDGNFYEKVKENSFLAVYTYTDGTSAKQSGANSYRYFKVEPIKWKVLTTNYNGPNRALLLCENVLTAGVPYYVSRSLRQFRGYVNVESNNYKFSTIRAYLNGKYERIDNSQAKTYENNGFLQKAFTDAAQSLILETEVDNSKETTGWAEYSYAEKYACENTTDKIFLLSESEVINSAYGFAAYNSYGQGNARIRVATDYAKATCTYQSKTAGEGAYWWLRSPSNEDYGKCARVVRYSGDANGSPYVDRSDFGIVPALVISLQ